MSEASSSVKNLEELQFFNIQSQLPGVAFTLIPQEKVVFEFKSVLNEETLTFYAFISPSFDP